MIPGITLIAASLHTSATSNSDTHRISNDLSTARLFSPNNQSPQSSTWDVALA